MKILIATGIFKPEPGGPATVALEMARRLSATGHEITIITYSQKSFYKIDEEIGCKIIRVVRTNSKIKNYWNYFKVAYKQVRKNSIIFGLDWFSAGVPLMIACKIIGKKYIMRVGGGYIWEKYLSEGRQPVTLNEFYDKKLYKNYSLMYRLIGIVLRNAEKVVFNSDKQRLLYNVVYNLDSQKTLTIWNAVPENRLSGLVQSYNDDVLNKDKEIVFVGRFIKMKNVESIIKAFANMKDKTFNLLLVGEGPLENDLHSLVNDLALEKRVTFIPAMSQSDLYRRISHCYCVVLPSWTDVSPNQFFECLALGIPVIMTKENFLPITLNSAYTVDPASVNDITEKLDKISDISEYEKFVKSQQTISFSNPWSNVVGEYLKIFFNLNRKSS